MTGEPLLFRARDKSVEGSMTGGAELVAVVMQQQLKD
jgi:hypothetical protein